MSLCPRQEPQAMLGGLSSPETKVTRQVLAALEHLHSGWTAVGVSCLWPSCEVWRRSHGGGRRWWRRESGRERK
jgi:hypothetical protein